MQLSELTRDLGFAIVMAAVLLLAGCSKSKPQPPGKPSAASPSPAPAIAKATAGAPVPGEEPSEAVLRKLEFQRYEMIDKAGGMPVTMTATGKSLTLHPKLYEVRKEKGCDPTPQAPPGWYECHLIIKLSLSPGGRDPSEQGERIGVKWDPKGEWVLQ
ncbi:MAG: hypothetical protein ABI919_11085 [Ramlibacter sp.]